jgi:hypothetical protein
MNNAINNQGFWQRQFSANVTRQQMTFDVIMGIFAPILCIILYPVVFNDQHNLNLGVPIPTLMRSY